MLHTLATVFISCKEIKFKESANDFLLKTEAFEMKNEGFLFSSVGSLFFLEFVGKIVG